MFVKVAAAVSVVEAVERQGTIREHRQIQQVVNLQLIVPEQFQHVEILGRFFADFAYFAVFLLKQQPFSRSIEISFVYLLEEG